MMEALIRTAAIGLAITAVLPFALILSQRPADMLPAAPEKGLDFSAVSYWCSRFAIENGSF